MSRRVSTATARKDLASVLRSSARGERIKLTRYNKTVAVILPKQALSDLEDCEKRRAGVKKSDKPAASRRSGR